MDRVFSLLSKKTVFFAFDLEKYTAERDFYFDYEDYVPGDVAKELSDLAEKVKGEFNEEKNNRFRSFNFGYTDAESSKRVVDAIIKKL